MLNQLNQKVQIENNSAKQVSVTGINEIMRLIDDETGKYIYIADKSYVTREGKIAKRIASHYYKLFGKKLDKALVEKIGNIAAMHTISTPAKYIVVSDDLDFYPEARESSYDCGDDTCLSPGGMYRSHFNGMVESGDFVCIKLYDANDMLMARAWCYMESDDMLYMFNAYGATLNDYANIIEATYGKKTRKITDVHYSSQSLYINSGTVMAVSSEKISSDHTVNVYDWNYEKSHELSCSNCGCEVDDDYYTNRTENGELLCDDCSGWCNICETTHMVDEMVYTDDGDYVCEYCHNENYTECRECRCEIAREGYKTYYNDDNEPFCEDCYTGLYSHCEKCDCEILISDSKENDNCEAFCESCFNETYVECECEAIIEKTDAYVYGVHHDLICEDCYIDKDDVAVQIQLDLP